MGILAFLGVSRSPVSGYFSSLLLSLKRLCVSHILPQIGRSLLLSRFLCPLFISDVSSWSLSLSLSVSLSVSLSLVFSQASLCSPALSLYDIHLVLLSDCLSSCILLSVFSLCGF